jgi:hypothetical protein
MGRQLPLILLGMIAAGLIGHRDRALAATLDFQDFQLNGAATVVDDSLQLTPAQPNQVGSAFGKTPFQLSADTSFQSYFSFQMTGGKASGGGDGLAMVFQADGRGATALGMQGGNLGYGGTPFLRITPSLAIEFDTFENTLAGITADPNNNHIGINRNGSLLSIATANPTVDLNGGSPVHVWLDYDGIADELAIALSSTPTRPSEPLLSTSLDLFTHLGPEVYWGFTAATEGAVGQHRILRADITFQKRTVSEPANGVGLLALALLGIGSAKSYQNRKKTMLN